MSQRDATANARIRQLSSITLAGAEVILWHALEEAAARDVAIAISVTDNVGQVLCSARMDRAPGLSLAISARKALTAAQMGTATRTLQRIVDGGRASYLAADELCCLSGGVPILHDQVVVGAVGISGADEETDHDIACKASAALG